MASEQNPLIGFIGLGAMGSRMAANVAAAGFPMICFDVAGTKDRAPEGAAIAASVGAVAAAAEIIILSLPNGAVSASVAEEIIETNQRTVSTIIDTSTIGVAAAKFVHSRLAGSELAYMDAPVSGGIAGAAAGSLALMFAGSDEKFTTLLPLMKAMSKNPFHVGTEAGQAQAMKLLNNFLSGLAMTATSEAISFGLTQGLEMSTMLDVLNVSSGQNTATSDKFPNRVLTELYNAEFLNTMYLKDISLYVENVAAAGTVDTISSNLLPIWQRFAAAEPGADITEIFPFLRDKR
ncbi:MAG: NAD(P)-dependent oxidoreductase [Alphaproteobacteria bacterium]|nr:NAD(P)-dependent oxidoreductase [Alphaproteobacteria bacterium]